jgi:hypothetical protein
MRSLTLIHRSSLIKSVFSFLLSKLSRLHTMNKDLLISDAFIWHTYHVCYFTYSIYRDMKLSGVCFCKNMMLATGNRITAVESRLRGAWGSHLPGVEPRALFFPKVLQMIWFIPFIEVLNSWIQTVKFEVTIY